MNSVTKRRLRPLSETAVLIAQALLMLIYGVFFMITPGILDNPTIRGNNAVFFIPLVTMIFALLGFALPKLSGMLMIVYAMGTYIVFVSLDRGHLAVFAYSLGPTWPPLVAGLALIWVARHKAKMRIARTDI
jgi:hypothetical protein